MKTESDTFKEFIDSLTWSQALAIELSALRPDQPWPHVANKIEELKQGLYRMVGSGAVKGTMQ